MARQRSGGTSRGVRVSEQVHHELAELVRGELKDPRVGMVTITGVELTPDYAYATVYFSVLPDDEASVAETLAGLRRAAGFLRSQLGRRVRIHTTPELRFVHDRSTERGIAMSKLIDEANRRRAEEDDRRHAGEDDRRHAGEDDRRHAGEDDRRHADGDTAPGNPPDAD